MEYIKTQCHGLVKANPVTMEKLLPNTEVLFNYDPYHCNDPSEYSGHVLFTNDINDTVCVSYLAGYKAFSDDIPLECIITYNPIGDDPYEKYL